MRLALFDYEVRAANGISFRLEGIFSVAALTCRYVAENCCSNTLENSKAPQFAGCPLREPNLWEYAHVNSAPSKKT